MKKITSQDFNEIRIWIYRNARQLELALWQYYFENGSREAVLRAWNYIRIKMVVLVMLWKLTAGIPTLLHTLRWQL